MNRSALKISVAVLFCLRSPDYSPLEGGQGGVAHAALNSPSLFFNQKNKNSDGYPRQPQFDLLHYDLAFNLSDTSNVIWGEAKLRVKIRSPIAVKNLRLDLKAMNVTRVSVEQYRATNTIQAAAFKHEAEAIDIALPANVLSGDTLNLIVNYHGEPKDGLIIGQNKFGRRTIFADNWPDRGRYWFPSIDHPSDKASVSMRVTLPAKYTVIANGTLEQVRETTREYKTWQWSEPAPIPTYCMVFGAAEFAVIPLADNGATPLSFYVYPEDAPHAEKNFGRVHEMMQFFTSRFGAYPYAKLALVQSSTRFGGMENASAIFFAEKSFGPERNIEGTTAHEIAHQWFGNSVTEADWHHLWLSEGFATYGEALFFEHADGAQRFRENMHAKRENYFLFAAQTRGPILDSTITNYMALLSPNNYAKAGWVLHMLRNVVGDEAFERGLKNYYARYHTANALTQDFRAVMEEASGMPLQWFFAQWLEQPDYPKLRVEWFAAPQQLELELRQTQERTFYRIPIELVLHSAQGEERAAFWMNERAQRITLPIQNAPERVTFDPEVKLLMSVEVVKAEKGLEHSHGR